MQQHIIASAHSYESGHYKSSSTTHRIRKSFYWLNLKSDVILYIKHCVQCNVLRPQLDFYKGKNASVENNILNSLVCTDLSGPHKEDLFGYKYVLVIVESSTRFLITELLKSKRPAEVARSFINRYIPVFGIPSKIMSDQGSEYHNDLFKNLCDALHIQHDFNPTDKDSANLAKRVI